MLEDDPSRIRKFAEWFVGHEWDSVQTCHREHEFVPPYDIVFLDHDLGGRQMDAHEDCGAEFVRLILDRLDPTTPIIVHSYNKGGAENMLALLKGQHQAVHLPFYGPDFMAAIDQIQAGAS